MNLIEDLLKKFIIEKTTEVELVTSKIKELELDKKNILDIISKSTLELQKVCTHEKSHKVMGTYMSGGYDHVSEQPYTINCTNCGKVLESKCIRGTYA